MWLGLLAPLTNYEQRFHGEAVKITKELQSERTAMKKAYSIIPSQ